MTNEEVVSILDEQMQQSVETTLYEGVNADSVDADMNLKEPDGAIIPLANTIAYIEIDGAVKHLQDPKM